MNILDEENEDITLTFNRKPLKDFMNSKNYKDQCRKLKNGEISFEARRRAKTKHKRK